MMSAIYPAQNRVILSADEAIKLACDHNVSPRQIIEKLEDYSNEESLTFSITKFVKAHFNEDIDITGVHGGETKGVSGAPVYQVWDKDHHLKAIAKAFLKHSEFVEELRATFILGDLKLAESCHVEIFAVGKCQYSREKRQAAFVLQTVAKGQGIDDHLLGFFREKNCFENQNALDRLHKIMRAAAKAFGELHVKTQSKDLSPADEYKEYIISINDMISKVKKYINTNKNYKISKLKNLECLEPDAPLIKEILRSPGVSAIVHGDGHPGNVFADITDDGKCNITFIDICSLDRSVAPDFKTGKLSPARDFSIFMVHAKNLYIRTRLDQNKFELDKPINLNLDQYSSLETAFRSEYDGYTQPNFQLTEAQKDFLAVRFLLGVICRDQKNATDLPRDKPEWHVMDQTICTNINIVNKMLEKYQNRLEEPMMKGEIHYDN